MNDSDPKALLGDVVCRTVCPGKGRGINLHSPGGAGQAARREDDWGITLTPEGTGIRVSVDRFVPYPADPHRIVTPAYAATVGDAIDQALAAATVAREAAALPRQSEAVA